jgi:hypothetical protein
LREGGGGGASLLGNAGEPEPGVSKVEWIDSWFKLEVLEMLRARPCAPAFRLAGGGGGAFLEPEASSYVGRGGVSLSGTDGGVEFAVSLVWGGGGGGSGLFKSLPSRGEGARRMPARCCERIGGVLGPDAAKVVGMD